MLGTLTGMASPSLLITHRRGPGAGWGVEQTLMHLHMGWGKPKAASEMSLRKRVLFPKDVIYVSP